MNLAMAIILNLAAILVELAAIFILTALVVVIGLRRCGRLK